MLSPFAGCTSREKQFDQKLVPFADSPLAGIFEKNLQASGSQSTWLKTTQIKSHVLATVLDSDGGQTILEQNHLLFPQTPLSLSITSQTPEGPWRETLDARDQVEIVLNGKPEAPSGKYVKWIKATARKLMDKASPPSSKKTIDDKIVLQGAGLKLRLFSQALSQSFGLLRDDWTIRYGGQERKGGRLTYKVIVDGPMLTRTNSENEPIPYTYGINNGDQMVIWVDSESFLFDRIWIRYRVNSPGQKSPYVYLAANLKKYKRQANGLKLPTYIGLVHSDAHQQFSETEILRIEALEYQMTEVEKKEYFPGVKKFFSGIGNWFSGLSDKF